MQTNKKLGNGIGESSERTNRVTGTTRPLLPPGKLADAIAFEKADEDSRQLSFAEYRKIRSRLVGFAVRKFSDLDSDLLADRAATTLVRSNVPAGREFDLSLLIRTLRRVGSDEIRRRDAIKRGGGAGHCAIEQAVASGEEPGKSPTQGASLDDQELDKLIAKFRLRLKGRKLICFNAVVAEQFQKVGLFELDERLGARRGMFGPPDLSAGSGCVRRKVLSRIISNVRQEFANYARPWFE
jgi:hypothetical protein